MTCFEVLEIIFEDTDPIVKNKIRGLLSTSCEAYNCALFCKSRRTANLMLNLFYDSNIQRIKKLCENNIDLLTHTLCVNAANYKKYSQSLGCFWYSNTNGLDVWSVPKFGDIMKTKIELFTPSGVKVPARAKVKMIKFIHKSGENNVLEAFIETKTGERFKCSCRNIRRLQKQ